MLPFVNLDAMNRDLEEIGHCVATGAHAVVVLDQAGWHGPPSLAVPDNITLLPLPPYSPELNPTENVWEYLRQNKLSLRVWDDYTAIVDTCCTAWNDLMATPERIASIATRDWANAVIA